MDSLIEPRPEELYQAFVAHSTYDNDFKGK
jgi:hypothetical protein